MKYKNNQIVDAIYTNTDTNNPFIEALPEKVAKQDFIKETTYRPQLLSSEYDVDSKLNYLNNIRAFSYSFDYMYEVYSDLYDCITDNYKTKNTYMFLKQNINMPSQKFFINSRTMSLLGTPGIGKSSTIKKCLDFFPKMISHTNYKNQSIYFKQIPYLYIECPFDCSVKSFALKIMTEIDAVAGTDYSKIYIETRYTIESIINYIEKMCTFFHFGVIVIDEIQNVVLAALKKKQTRLLMKVVLGLSNSSCSSLYFSGTLEAEQLFESEEYLKRRTLGKRLLPLKKDKIYYLFLTDLWKCKIINEINLTKELASGLYEITGGIPFYIVEMFILMQKEYLLSEDDKIDLSFIKKIADKYNVHVYPEKEGGMSISDFAIKDKEARKVGRPVLIKENDDITGIYEKAQNINELISKLDEIGLIERSTI